MLSTHAFDRRVCPLYRGRLLSLLSTYMAATEKSNDLGGLEKSLEELEALVTRLESGDLPLEQALKEFEHGVKLTRQCQAALQEAEQKVEILLKKTAQAEPTPFEADADDERA
jgi:exodeoxyribonuclease VII small subunit